VESQATGRPVVTSNVLSMPEVAGDTACLVVMGDDYISLVTAIKIPV